jgi:rubrerythrin
MNTALKDFLAEQVRKGSIASVRNLAAAEAAVLKGQFNVAKVLRASAHAQRILALDAARLLTDDLDTFGLLEGILSELEDPRPSDIGAQVKTTNDIDPSKLQQYETVSERLKEIVQRSLASLAANPDVMESDVQQFLWGCYGCGYLVEGDRPQSCTVCGAPSVEFEWFGPFYAATPEHLGQLSRSDMLAILESVTEDIAQVLSNTSGEVLGRKPSEEEWSIKEIIGHMVETHRLFAERVQVILQSEGIPAIPRSKPPWKLHEGKGYEDLPPQELHNRLRNAIAGNVELLRNIEPDQWSRQGILLGASTSVLDLGSWLTNHDRGHLAQIRQLSEA